MDNVIQAVERSLEFLILGGLALGLVASLCGLPTLGRWVTTWNAHVSLVTQRPDDHSHVSESQATAHMAFAGILFFSMTYVLGFLISDLGAWALQPAHLDVIRATHQFVCSKEQAPNPLDPSGRFWLLPFRHFCSLPPDYYGALRGDDERQQYWQMYQTASYNDALGPLFKQIRFVRGLSFLSLSAALVLLPISIVRWIKGARSWRTCFLGLCLSLASYMVLMGAFWTIEANLHRQVWSAKFLIQPALDKTAPVVQCATVGP